MVVTSEALKVLVASS